MSEKKTPADSRHSACNHEPINLVRLNTLDDRSFAIWSKYEDVAIHFNDLLMRWRIQAIGGLLTLLTLAGFVVGDAETLATRYRAMLILSGTLSIAWLGVALIDLFYYRRLLDGAVDAIAEIERVIPDLRLSHMIDGQAKCGGRWTPYVFYLTGWIPLLGTVWWAIYQIRVLSMT